MDDRIQVLTTVDSSGEAKSLAAGILEARLAACVQIVGPIRSLYHWKGRVEDDEEWQLLIKTATSAYPRLEEHLKAHHSYETPEIIATPIVAGSAEYLGWIGEEIS